MKPLIVIGMHRSGTTLLAQMMRKLGVFMGYEVDSNHEPLAIVQANEELLRLCGATWDWPEPVRRRLRSLDSAQMLTGQLKEITGERLQQNFLGERRYNECGGDIRQQTGVWGFKDPRNSYTLPIWDAWCGGSRILHIHRHGVDVAASLYRRHRSDIVHKAAQRYGVPFIPPHHIFRMGLVYHTTRCCDLGEAFALWEEYMWQARRYVRLWGQDALELSYESLLADPESALETLAAFIGIEVTEEVQAEIRDMIRTDRASSYRNDPELVGFAETVHPRLGAFGYTA